MPEAREPGVRPWFTGIIHLKNLEQRQALCCETRQCACLLYMAGSLTMGSDPTVHIFFINFLKEAVDIPLLRCYFNVRKMLALSRVEC